MDTIHIALALNDNVVIPATVLIQSIGANKGDEQVVIHLISITKLKQCTIDILNSHSAKFGIVTEYHVFELPKTVTDCSKDIQHWSNEVFLKLFVSDILPNLEKVIVLDVDIIVRHSLSDLWNVDLNNSPLAGVVDAGFGFDVLIDSDIFYDRKFRYLNAGMLLMNLDYIRDHNILQAYISVISGHPEKFTYNEQSVINNVVYDTKKILHLKYNLFIRSFFCKYHNYPYLSRREVADAMHDPVIVHFAGSVKPWHKYCRNPYVNEWNRYLKQTTFKDYHKQMPVVAGSSISLRTLFLLYLVWRICHISLIYKCRWI